MIKLSHLLIFLLFTVSAFGKSKHNLPHQNLSYQNLPEPYRSLKQVLPFDAHGWYGNGAYLEPLIKTHNIQIVVEVGSWLGASTRHIASLIPPNGKVYAIDHWQGSVEHQPGESAWYKALPYLYDQFLSNVIHAGLAHKIIPLRMDSLQAAQQLYLLDGFVMPDLIYIDAGHETAAVYADLQAWYPYVQGRGILCGDDWSWASVRAAVEAFSAERALKIIAGDNFWRLEE